MAVVKDKEARDDKEKSPPRENALVRTFREVRAEMKKVVWPTREETARLTSVVVAVSAVASVILALFDFVFTFLLQQLQSLVAQ
jgi:preprotein translocase subunit SecE